MNKFIAFLTFLDVPNSVNIKGIEKNLLFNWEFVRR